MQRTLKTDPENRPSIMQDPTAAPTGTGPWFLPHTRLEPPKLVLGATNPTRSIDPPPHAQRLTVARHARGKHGLGPVPRGVRPQ